jgi:hypothetical protein
VSVEFFYFSFHCYCRHRYSGGSKYRRETQHGSCRRRPNRVVQVLRRLYVIQPHPPSPDQPVPQLFSQTIPAGKPAMHSISTKLSSRAVSIISSAPLTYPDMLQVIWPSQVQLFFAHGFLRCSQPTYCR